jgi:hypothetical protein
MAELHNVFLSWSGARSKAAAKALKAWLPVVLQAASPWMSDEDIDKGSRGLDEVGKALEGMKIGIICLTDENLTEPWILYEAGALSKTLDAKTRICTYLLGDLEPQNVKAPLGLFQYTRAQQEDTRKLLHTINKALDTPLSEAHLDAAFDGQWPRLAEKLATLPPPEKHVRAERSSNEMIVEILEISRAAAQSRKSVQELDQYLPLFKQIMPMLEHFVRAAPPLPTKQQTVSRPLRAFLVKQSGQDNPQRLLAAALIEIEKGEIVAVDHDGEVLGFASNVEKYWPEEDPAKAASSTLTERMAERAARLKGLRPRKPDQPDESDGEKS